MNTYIQDKLDEFDRIANTMVENGGLYNAYEGLYPENVSEWIEKALTDYHNHIVEMLDDRLDNLTQSDEFNAGYTDSIDTVRALQDTNLTNS